MTDPNPPAGQHSPGRAVPVLILLLVLAAVVIVYLLMRSPGSSSSNQTHVMAGSPAAAGRYLILVGGCNDCHTPGFMEQGMKVPESQWLTGVPLGWRGPWGTTYSSNLRLYAQTLTEEGWVMALRNRNARPPMPWPNLNEMSDQDLRAIYRYIRSLPLAGEKMPDWVPPDREPTTPYLVMAPPTMPKDAPAP